MGLHSLSLELVENIYRYLGPASHLDFALIDKHIFHFSNRTLERHRECHQSYRNFTEQDPESLINLLENVTKDHVAAWHIRTFEGLNARPGYTAQLSHESASVALAKKFYAAMTANKFPPFKLDRMRTDRYLFEVIQTAILAFSTGIHTIKSKLFFPALDDNASENDIWADELFPQ
jgi:hypothetical protein